jgi:hypothetical protein
MMSDIRKVSDGTSAVGKYLRNFLTPCFGSDCVWECRNISQTVRKKYTTFSTVRIVALRSVDKIFLESYDITAKCILHTREFAYVS